MTSVNLLTFVLHSHLPYVRKNGVSPCGEDFFNQAAFESHLPLIDVLERLSDRGVRPGLTLGITPVLASQMEDAHLLHELRMYLGSVELRAWQLAANQPRDPGLPHAGQSALAARAAISRLDRLPGGIASGFAELERTGAIEIAGGPASHPLLSGAGSHALLRAHLAAGIGEHRRVFGREPSTLWMPECAYAPGQGIEQVLQEAGARAVVVDAHLANAPTLIGDSSVTAFPMDRVLVDRVWSAGGYPSNPWYRSFDKQDWESGFKTWRVTQPGVDWPKEPYEPEPAAAQAEADAEDFVALVERRFAETGNRVITIAFDTELFGHWWHEGPQWLERVLDLIAKHPSIRLVTLSEALEETSVPRRADLPAGTWGDGGDERSWHTGKTEWMWDVLADAETRTAAFLRKHDPSPALDQLLREFLLLASSDWPFMVTQRRAPEYGRERFEAHRDRLERLASLIESGDPSAVDVAAALYEIDNPFPDLSAARAALTG